MRLRTRTFAPALLLCVAVPQVHAAPGIDSSAASQPGMAMAAPTDSVLDFAVVVRRVLEQNPTLSEARATWSAARARVRQAGSLEDPMLDAMAAPRSFGSANVDAAWRIALAQPLPMFGQRGLLRREADAEAQAAGWDLRTTELDLVHEARVRFLDYWRIARAAALNRELVALFGELRRTTLARYAAGLVGQQDPLQVETRIAGLDHQAVVIERERLVAAATLNALMHEPVERPLPPPPRDLPLPDTSLVHAALAPAALAQRPELDAAAARVQAGQAAETLARRGRLPETSFSFTWDRFWSERELQPAVGVSVSLPLSGRHAAAAAAARAELAARVSHGEVLRDSVALQVAVAAARFHEQAHDVAIARLRMLPLAERMLRVSRASYAANRTGFPAVVEAVDDYLTARLEADASLAMLLEARADLDRALGTLPSLAGEGRP